MVVQNYVDAGTMNSLTERELKAPNIKERILEKIMDIILTKHAEKRMNQRGISKEMMELIYEHGREQYDHRGGVRIMLTKKMIGLLVKRLPKLKKMFERVKSTYLVISSNDGAVITAGHLYV
jgi:hypothetical protein